ncbi:helix-turn-helix transcriptional regulator [Frankia sp. AgKG'84/4]|uniref:helix-turn-helix transcriptional regulator n=1 Tax=Frankia sp. AgKG'84/4 TaxID=573490 RepID=UPI00200D71FA|nr:LuxR family transcriptional regulator [Frankia sp. AgKG'84/4]MCL9794490.1 LuxR C-terminal-related transcriptional regulator [Frankia sp. AgKG'84/4]
MIRDSVAGLGLAMSDASGVRRPLEGCENLTCAVDQLVTVSAWTWRGGDLGRGLALAGRAATDARSACVGRDCRSMAGVWYAFLLTYARDLRAANQVLDDVLADGPRELGEKVRASAGMCRAEIQFALDRMDDAADEAEAAIAALDGIDLDVMRPIGHMILARRALRRADIDTALLHTDQLMSGVLLSHARHMPGQSAWVSAEVREVREAPESVAPIVRGLVTDEQLAGELLAAQPEAAAWLVRAARRLGDEDLAELAVERVRTLSVRNPSFGALRAAAMHASALFRGDDRALVAVAEMHIGRRNQASALEDAASVLRARRTESGGSADLLRQAADHYLAVGASRDGSRVARKLRDVGIRGGRIPRVGATVSGAGVGQLTDTEFAVAELVSQGLTNTRVGQEMFISTHTVAAHLKKIFRKLGLSSRVELASRWERIKKREVAAGSG